jgi:hypothetical protein
MIIKTKFEIKDRVVILDANLRGKVVGFYYDIELQYEVRYFDSGDYRIITFHEDEIRKEV